MTSQSPRIYIYKITFEEVLYYYYGVHKEKYFNEEYWGSPATHKWCWEFYTPKKQILQIFDFTDEGWLEAQEIEKRLIRPFYNTDKWCLNESCGGKTSIKQCRKAGLINGNKTKEFGIGIFSQCKEELCENGKKGGMLGGKKTYELGIGIHSLSKEERSKYGTKSITLQREKGIGVFARTEEERKKSAQKSKETNQRNGTGIYSLSAERRREIIKNTNSQKWKCLETGHISTPGALTRYQNNRGIDTTKRVRIE